ncbi:hypothetical protein [Microbacterium gorillae]|uniref:hypothetical protein n=1 Tax=Microbacterium gorillae TaxID=1231063 RepID=UPI003D96A7F0
MKRGNSQQPVSLWRTPRQSIAWTLRGKPFRAALITLIVTAVAAGVVWQWPAVSWAYDKVASAFQPEQPPYIPVDFSVSVSDEVASRVDELRENLTFAVGSAGTLITSKAAEGVPADKIAPTQAALASAKEALDKGVRMVPLLTERLDRLTAATTALTAEKAPPPPPTPVVPPTEPIDTESNGGSEGQGSSEGNGGFDDANTGGSDNTGGNESPTGGGGGVATTSSSLTCQGGTVRVTFTASGGGNVQISVSGPAGGSNSGSGSATVVVTGSGGTYSASASAEGSVAISGSCG